MSGPARDEPFCSNLDCILHVRSGDAGVIGWGNWAELADGTIIGRGIYDGIYLCDPCGHGCRVIVAFDTESL